MDISSFGSFFHSFLSSLFMEISLSFSRTNCPQKQPPPNEAGHLICCQQWGLQAAASSTLGVNTMDSTARREPVLSPRLFVARVLLSQDTVVTPSFPECKEGSTQTSSSKQGDLTRQGRLHTAAEALLPAAPFQWLSPSGHTPRTAATNSASTCKTSELCSTSSMALSPPAVLGRRAGLRYRAPPSDGRQGTDPSVVMEPRQNRLMLPEVGST